MYHIFFHVCRDQHDEPFLMEKVIVRILLSIRVLQASLDQELFNRNACHVSRVSSMSFDSFALNPTQEVPSQFISITKVVIQKIYQAITYLRT